MTLASELMKKIQEKERQETHGSLMQQLRVNYQKLVLNKLLAHSKLRLQYLRLSYYQGVLIIATQIIRIGTRLGTYVARKMEKDCTHELIENVLSPEVEKVIRFKK